ncbi:hypothetical protein GCM10027051_23610 [Niabella terrae]
MKKLFIVVLVLVAAFLVYKYAFKKGSDGSNREKPEAVAVSAHTDAFNESVNAVLSAYYQMTDGFVNWDSAAVGKDAAILQKALDSFQIEELKKDTLIYETAVFPYSNTKSNTATILETADWEGKRRAYQNLSENLRNLLIVVKYDQDTLYWQECPMAFNEDESANWISPDATIVNPYLGKKHPKYGATMLNCGETKEEISFSPDSIPQ